MNVAPDTMEIALKLGKRIRYHRKRLGLRQRHIAERIGASVSAISDVERGYSLPSIPRLVEIAGALDLRASDLLEAL